jgi:hypothetical protein
MEEEREQPQTWHLCSSLPAIPFTENQTDDDARVVDDLNEICEDKFITSWDVCGSIERY